MDEQQPQKITIRREIEVKQSVNVSHHITNTEWGLVIGALIIVDVIQIILDFFVIGAAINRFIDILVGGFLALYVKLRCKNINFGKSMWRLLLTFLGEELPLVDALPLWTLDGLYNMSLERAGEKMKRIEVHVPPISKTINMKKGVNGEWNA